MWNFTWGNGTKIKKNGVLKYIKNQNMILFNINILFHMFIDFKVLWH